MKGKAADYLILDPETGKYREDPEQAVRDDVEKHYWVNVGRTIVKDWRLRALPTRFRMCIQVTCVTLSVE